MQKGCRRRRRTRHSPRQTERQTYRDIFFWLFYKSNRQPERDRCRQPDGDVHKMRYGMRQAETHQLWDRQSRDRNKHRVCVVLKQRRVCARNSGGVHSKGRRRTCRWNGGGGYWLIAGWRYGAVPGHDGGRRQRSIVYICLRLAVLHHWAEPTSPPIVGYIGCATGRRHCPVLRTPRPPARPPCSK